MKINNDVQNWGKMSSEQILDLKKAGVKVPDKYAEWAQKMAKDVTAKSDDITSYEIVDDSNEKNEAKDLRNELENQDMSLRSIAKIFIGKCENEETDVMKAMEGLVQQGEESESLENKIEQVAQQAEQKIDALTSRIEALENKEDSEKTDEDKTKQAGLASQAAGVADAANGTTGGLSAKLKSIGASIENAITTAGNAKETADETVSIGEKLLKSTAGEVVSGILTLGISSLFGRKNKKTGQRALKAGEQLNGFVEQANEKANDAASKNGFSIVKSSQAIKDVKDKAKEAEASVNTSEPIPKEEEEKKKPE